MEPFSVDRGLFVLSSSEENIAVDYLYLTLWKSEVKERADIDFFVHGKKKEPRATTASLESFVREAGDVEEKKEPGVGIRRRKNPRRRCLIFEVTC